MNDFIEKLVMAEYEVAQTLKMVMLNLKDENYKLAMYSQMLYLEAKDELTELSRNTTNDEYIEFIDFLKELDEQTY